jgi:hypothetical protein
MKTAFRSYTPEDFFSVRDFLVSSVKNYEIPPNWFLDRWNFVSEAGRIMNCMTRAEWASHIGLWIDESGEILAMANEEEGKGDVFFQFAHPRLAQRGLLEEMFAFAEERLAFKGSYRLRASLPLVAEMAEKKGYARTEWSEPWSRKPLARLERGGLPENCRFALPGEMTPSAKALAHSRAFGYAGKEGKDGKSIEAFANLPGLPDWRPELDIGVLGPEGDIVAFAGVWLDIANKLCVLEPVGTVPEHRRKGLAHAAITLGLFRAREAGAINAWVGSDQAFYKAIGFEVVNRQTLWEFKANKI